MMECTAVRTKPLKYTTLLSASQIANSRRPPMPSTAVDGSGAQMARCTLCTKSVSAILLETQQRGSPRAQNRTTRESHGRHLLRHSDKLPDAVRHLDSKTPRGSVKQEAYWGHWSQLGQRRAARVRAPRLGAQAQHAHPGLAHDSLRLSDLSFFAAHTPEHTVLAR